MNMSKKAGVYARSLKMGYVVCCIVALLFCRVHATEDLFSRICTWFVSCDSILDEIGNELGQAEGVQASEKLLMDKITAHPHVELFLRTNAKGSIISRVTRERIEPRRYKNVSDQTWYKILEISRKTYYGSLTNTNGSYLFWCKPLFTKSGNRFSGALAVKMNLNTVFSGIAAHGDDLFEIVYRNEIIYSNLEQKSAGGLVSKTLPVYGLPGVTLRYKTGVPAVSIGSEKPDSTGTNVQEAAGPNPDAASLRQGKSGAEGLPAVKGREREKGGVLTDGRSMVVYLVCIVVCLGFVVYILKKTAERNRKILEEIDKASYE